jgi:hypothetical protein
MILCTDIVVKTERLLLIVSLKDFNNIHTILEDSLAIWKEQQPKLK